jgi:signal transduction histidine kinase
MNPVDASNAASSGATPCHRVPAGALDALRNPLTAILGRSQVLERRILREVHVSPDDTLAALEAIERSAWEVEGQLRALQREVIREG